VIFDLIRAVASFAVLIGHALSIFPIKGFYLLWPQQIGVIVFFLLSGYLITETLSRRLANPQSRFIDYAIDRWCRIYSGFLPAILLVAGMDYFCITHYQANGETIERFTFYGFLTNAAMLQAPAIALPFGSAAPFWTVAIEFWIYMFVGLIAFSIKNGITLLGIVAIILTGIIPVQSLTTNNEVLIPWLMGAASQQLIASRALSLVPNWSLWSIAAVAFGVLTFHIHSGGEIYSLYAFVMVALTFTATITVYLRTKPATPPAFDDGVRWWAAWSYSLYLLHHSVLMFVATTMHGGTRILYGIAASILVSVVFASLTEKHHRELASYLKHRLRQNRKIAENLIEQCRAFLAGIN
jgi:peptidoglycan/LPS O-acetylase OafA/YrhL